MSTSRTKLLSNATPSGFAPVPTAPGPYTKLESCCKVRKPYLAELATAYLTLILLLGCVDEVAAVFKTLRQPRRNPLVPRRMLHDRYARRRETGSGISLLNLKSVGRRGIDFGDDQRGHRQLAHRFCKVTFRPSTIATVQWLGKRVRSLLRSGLTILGS